jgi:sulfite exporter TauE/SafE
MTEKSYRGSTHTLMARMRQLMIIALLCLGLFFILNFSQFLGGHFEAPKDGQPLSLALLFIAGTLTGFHCAGMCGALVVGYTVKTAAEGGAKYLTHLYYGVGKTLSYTVIGGLYGALGSVISFTPFMRGVAGLAAGIFLLLFGLATLRVFAPLARFQLKTPGFLMRWVGGALRRNTHPFVIGLLNGLMIICGPLQAMYIMAAGTGSPVEGARMLFVFGLGTLPLMMGFGFMASALSRQFAPRLVRVSGIIVVALGVIMLNRGYAMMTTGTDLHAGMNHAGHETSTAQGSAPSMIHTLLEGLGPVTEQPSLKAGEAVEWMVGGSGMADCGSSISLPALNLEFAVQPGMNTLRFTPTQPGALDWTCQTGNIRGTFLVEKTGPSPKMDIPMADKILELIEKSASALEALRRQLHP